MITNRSCRTRSPTVTESSSAMKKVADLRKKLEGYSGPIVNSCGVR
jgi:hypothetical protein